MWSQRRSSEGWRDAYHVGNVPRVTNSGWTYLSPVEDPESRGSVTVESGTVLHPHELASGYRLTAVGLDVRFLGIINKDGVKNPDIFLEGKIWELKSPIGGGKHNISKQFRRAKEQADRVIIDLSRSKHDEHKALEEIAIRTARHPTIKESIAILKNGDVVRFGHL